MGYSKEKREKLKREGICVNCGSRPSREGRVTCQTCFDKNKVYYPQGVTAARKQRKVRREEGWCTHCGQVRPEAGKVQCAVCRRALTDKARLGDWRRKLKKLVMDEYGGKCVCCGETEILMLTLDHVNNNGNVHRLELNKGKKGGAGHKIYVWARDNNYPDSLQVLCWNCNVGKQLNGGVCPHVK